jgi:hypothetical protein
VSGEHKIHSVRFRGHERRDFTPDEQSLISVRDPV